MSILQKNKKTAAGIGIAAVAAAALALSAGTYAAFFDEEAGPTGTLAAGTLDLVVGGTATTTLFEAGNIQPGYTAPSRTFTIQNKGNLDGKLDAIVTVNGADGTCTEPEQAVNACGAAGDLQDELLVKIIGPLLPAGGIEVPVSQLQQTFTDVQIPPMPSAVSYTLVFRLPESVGNEVQGDTVTIASTFRLDQL
jgi:spore coat-associated protein N